MKNKIFATAFFAMAFFACKKDDEKIRGISSYTFVNATTDVANARIAVADRDIFWRSLPPTDASAQYRQINLSVFEGVNGIKVVSANDTTKTIYSKLPGVDFKAGTLNTLFLSGNSSNYEGILLENDHIVNRADSVYGVRFINLSPNSAALNITLSTSPAVNEAIGLAYKQVTTFKTYPSRFNTLAMTFQVRDTGGTLLASYTLPYGGSGTYATAGIANARFKNLTLVIKGLQGTTTGSNALGIFPITHY